MKIAINQDYGGFNLSIDAEREILKRMGYKNLDIVKNGGYTYFVSGDTELEGIADDDRTNEHLEAVIEEKGVLANGKSSNLKVVEIPDDVDWEIEEWNVIENGFDLKCRKDEGVCLIF